MVLSKTGYKSFLLIPNASDLYIIIIFANILSGLIKPAISWPNLVFAVSKNWINVRENKKIKRKKALGSTICVKQRLFLCVKPNETHTSRQMMKNLILT